VSQSVTQQRYLHVVNSTTTPYDFGAYEFGALLDTIFRGRFEPELPQV
jgi:hypothetical protein